LEDLGLLVVKNHLPLQFVENVWLKCFDMHLCSSVIFPSKKWFSQEMLPSLVGKTKQLIMFY
jgi:hypothetical protein